ncbi:MAG TPA: prepilin-type N-terminal cleavage/methylation domain-containing protein [Candidatus Sulfotelmatobacter sp.]|nr:prepilin-type N-terminal cleavage/methylation domain-containing protein [Candidatus Sulfotelmatobacter sp.]
MTKSRASQQSGFTIIETMIAIAITGIGIITLIAAFAAGLAATQTSQENLIARQKTLEAMESIYTARNTQQLSFSQISNFPTGIFSSGSTQLLCAGPDGLVNTTDDVNCPANGPCVSGPECVVMPGPDGILGTADDVGMSLGNFTRQVQINPVLESDGVTVNPTLKQITVTVSYIPTGLTAARSYQVNALISAYR